MNPPADLPRDGHGDPADTGRYPPAALDGPAAAAGSEDGGEALRREVERLRAALVRVGVDLDAVPAGDDLAAWLTIGRLSGLIGSLRAQGVLPRAVRFDTATKTRTSSNLPKPSSAASAPVGGRSQDEQERPPALVHAAVARNGLWGPRCDPALLWAVPLVQTDEHSVNQRDSVTCPACRAALQERPPDS
jgi:hypothetical protein